MPIQDPTPEDEALFAELAVRFPGKVSRPQEALAVQRRAETKPPVFLTGHQSRRRVAGPLTLATP
jgi:hypothetical protein